MPQGKGPNGDDLYDDRFGPPYNESRYMYQTFLDEGTFHLCFPFNVDQITMSRREAKRLRESLNRFLGTETKVRVFGLNNRLNFGKHRDKLVSTLIREEPGYLEWALDNLEWFTLSDGAARELDWKLDQED